MSDVQVPETALAQQLLNPRSVALIGISDDGQKTSGRPLRFLRQAGFKGAIYNVNPRRDRVQGEPAFRSLSDLPCVPDHAFVLTNTDAAIASVEECGRLGVPVVTVLAAGFSESGPAGVAREQRLKDAAARYGIRVLGPSALGVINPARGLVLTANAAFSEPVPVGGVFCASHSGSMIGALVTRGRQRGIGFRGMVTVGNEVDLSIGEICRATVDDPAVTSYMLFLESLRHAESLRDFAIAAAQRGKPVVAYKLGRSAAAAELAVSHTGALAGEDAVADAFLADCGIARVETLDGFLESLPLLTQMRKRPALRRRSVGVVTTTGGGAAMAVDQLGIRNVDVVPPSAETLKRLSEAGIEVAAGRIIDLTLAGARYEVMKAALDVLQSAAEFDLLLAVVGSSARTQPELAVKPIVDSIGGGKPLACFIVPEAPDALRLLADGGVPAFRSPEACGDVIAAALRLRQPGAHPLSIVHGTGSATLDESEAYRLFDRVGVPHAPFQVLELHEPVPVLPFDYPVVAKILDPDIAHKSDVGGVVLNISDAARLGEAMKKISRSVAGHFPEKKPHRFLVQPMCAGLGEVLIGFRRDPQVGPLVMLAAGGILAEIYQDKSMRLAPVSHDTAREMIAEVNALKALSGFRGLPKGDLEALAEALVAVSRLALLSEPVVQEAEINPLLVLPEEQGVMAVDALASRSF